MTLFQDLSQPVMTLTSFLFNPSYCSTLFLFLHYPTRSGFSYSLIQKTHSPLDFYSHRLISALSLSHCVNLFHSFLFMSLACSFWIFHLIKYILKSLVYHFWLKICPNPKFHEYVEEFVLGVRSATNQSMNQSITYIAPFRTRDLSKVLGTTNTRFSSANSFDVAFKKFCNFPLCFFLPRDLFGPGFCLTFFNLLSIIGHLFYLLLLFYVWCV